MEAELEMAAMPFDLAEEEGHFVKVGEVISQLSAWVDLGRQEEEGEGLDLAHWWVDYSILSRLRIHMY